MTFIAHIVMLLLAPLGGAFTFLLLTPIFLILIENGISTILLAIGRSAIATFVIIGTGVSVFLLFKICFTTTPFLLLMGTYLLNDINRGILRGWNPWTRGDLIGTVIGFWSGFNYFLSNLDDYAVCSWLGTN